MPVYEYRCNKCGRDFQLLRSIAHLDDPACCPHCGGDQVRRLLSTFSSRSKDSGGLTRSLGGSSCVSCSATSCRSCGR